MRSIQLNMNGYSNTLETVVEYSYKIRFGDRKEAPLAGKRNNKRRHGR